MSTLQQTLENHAFEFAAAIVNALRGASIDELVAIKRPARVRTSTIRPGPVKSTGRLGRRSTADIMSTLDRIVALVAQHPEGLRAEQIKTALQLDTREIPRPLAEGLKSGALTKKGQKRATTYFVGSKKRSSSKN